MKTPTDKQLIMKDQIKTIAEEIKKELNFNITASQSVHIDNILTRHLAEQPDKSLKGDFKKNEHGGYTYTFPQPDKSLDDSVDNAVKVFAEGTIELSDIIHQACLDYAAKVTKERDEQHTMQLAAISTASISNTEYTWNEVQNCHKDYQSTAFWDVIKAVRREMDKQAGRDSLKQQLEEAKEQLESALNPIHSCGDNCQRAACVLRRQLTAERKVSDLYHEAWNGYKIFPSMSWERKFDEAETTHQQLRNKGTK